MSPRFPYVNFNIHEAGAIVVALRKCYHYVRDWGISVTIEFARGDRARLIPIDDLYGLSLATKWELASADGLSMPRSRKRTLKNHARYMIVGLQNLPKSSDRTR